MNADQKIVKAKTWLILQKPFFGSLVLRLKFLECNTINTAATDGVNLLWNRNFIENLNIEEVRGLLAHEVMHCASQHHIRRGVREPEKWNEAGDHVINLILKQEGFQLPEGGLHDEKYTGLSTEHVYQILPDPDPDLENQPKPSAFGVVVDAGSLGLGEGNDGEPGSAQGHTLSPSEIAEIEQDWKIAVQQAGNAAKAAGNLPAHLSTFIDEVVQPKIPWKDMLRNFCSQPMKGDYSWMRGNRRHLHQGLYLPSNFTEGLGTVVIAVDTSASVSMEELSQFQSELNCILEDTIPEKIHVVYVDTKVAGTAEYSADDLPVRLEVQGRGGTRFEPAFEWVTEQEINPAVFIYLTDLEASFNMPEPHYPVMWVTTGNQKQSEVPFGTLTNLEV